MAAAKPVPPWALVIGGVLLAPLVTWLPMLVMRWPNLANGILPIVRETGLSLAALPPFIVMLVLGLLAMVAGWRSRGLALLLGVYAADVILSGPLPLMDLTKGLDFWQLQIFWATGVFVLAASIHARDPWLAALLAFAALGVLFHGVRLDAGQILLLVIGIVMLLAARQTPRAWRPRVALLLGISGLVQAVYMVQQVAFRYDLLWGPLFGASLKPHIDPIGTLGTVDAASAYVAITAPLMPWWGVPIAAWAILGGRSYGALAALVIGLALRWWAPSWRARSAVVAFVGLSGVAGWGILHLKGLATVTGRLQIQAFALRDWWQGDPLVGYGLSGWFMRIPGLQHAQAFRPNGEYWAQAHSEWFQALYELGVVGLILILGWCWAHRRGLMAQPWRAPVAALAVVSATFFPFHVGSTAMLGAVILGLGTADAPAGG